MFDNAGYEQTMLRIGIFVVGVIIGVLSQRIKFTWK